MKTTSKSDIIEEYEKIKEEEHDRILSRQDADSKRILSADRIEDLLCFPIDSQENLRKTDRIYMTDDNRRLLLIREYGDMGSSQSVNSSSTTASSPQKSASVKSEERVPTNKSIARTKRSIDSNQDNGCAIDFKVLVDDNTSKSGIHQIHVQGNCPNFVPNHLYINGIKFSRKP